MNNQKWTAEPWTLFKEYDAICIVKDHKLKCIVEYGKSDLPEREANVERIVECVNACKGIQGPATAIPAMVEALKGVRAALSQHKTFESDIIASKIWIDYALKQAGAL